MSDVADWWETGIIDMAPGRIRIRGRPIEDLIGAVGFPEMVWLMTRGDLPGEGEARLLEAALVAAVDHGPQSPAIAAARMSVTCGLGLNGALSNAVNMLDDVHGGAGEQAVALFGAIDSAGIGNLPAELDRWTREHGPFVPGYGHRFHKSGDPRAPALLGLVDEAAREGTVTGRFAAIGRAVEAELGARKGRRAPMNIDGATAVVFAELGFPAPLARGLFCLSRSVGAIAHSWEQMEQGGRNKGPTPPGYRWTYTGPNPIPAEEGDPGGAT